MVVVASELHEAARELRAPNRGAVKVADVLRVDIGRVAKAVWSATAVVLGLGILREIVLPFIGTDTVLQDLRHFALDAEHSLPAWYESMSMVAAAALLATIAALATAHDRRNRPQWLLLAVIFLVLSIDEAVAFHEVSMAPLRDTFRLTGFLYFSWVLIAAPLLVAFGLLFARFLYRLPRRTALGFILAGTMFVVGAFGLELVGGYFVSQAGFDYLPYKIAATSEECLEIAGMTVFVLALLRHLAETTPMLRIAVMR